MTLSNFTYLLLLLFSISYPLYKSFEERIQMYKSFKVYLISITSVAIPFIIWDVIFEHLGTWSFNPQFVTGIYILNLPLEEWLFFFIVPYACIFIYEVLNYFFKADINVKLLQSILFILSIVLFVVSYIYRQQIYTFVISFVMAVLLLVQVLFNSPHSNWKAIRAFLVSLIPFILMNGLLTFLPVVSYNDAENSGFRIFTIPVEDAGYLYILLMLNFMIIEFLRKKSNKHIG